MEKSKRNGDIIMNEKGIALVVVLMVVVVLSILGLSLLALSANNIKQTTLDREYQATYYIAESGVTATLNRITTAANQLYENDSFSNANDFFNSLEKQFLDFRQAPSFDKTTGDITPTAEITIDQVSSNALSKTYNISSKGKIGNRIRRLDKEFTITWVPQNKFEFPTDVAAYIDTKITLNNGHITGGLATNASEANSITLDGSPTITGNIYVGPYAKSNVINKPSWMSLTNRIIQIPKEREFTIPEFPKYPVYPNHNPATLNIDYSIFTNYTGKYKLDLNNKDWTFTDINLTSNSTLFIDVGANDRKIVLKNLNVYNGHIIVLGTGTLTFYVENSIIMGSGSSIKNNGTANPNKITFYLKGSGNPNKPKSLTIGGSQKIYGSLFAEDANLNFRSGSGFEGHVMTGGKKVEIDGAAYSFSKVFYAPYADVFLAGSGKIKGTLVAKSLHVSGGAGIQHDLTNNDTFPFFPDQDGSDQTSSIIETKPIKEIK